MSDQHNPINWRVLVDRFIWSDSKALALIPKEISNEEIQQYLNTYHTDTVSLEEIEKWRTGNIPDDDESTLLQSYDLWNNTSL